MYKPKFREGDVIIPDETKIQTFERINDSFIMISRIHKLNNTFYYTIKGDYNFGWTNELSTLFPTIDIDKCYKLDKIYLRKGKLEKIIYTTKEIRNNER